MDSSICIVLMVVLILCFALLLAWLAAKSEDPSCVKLTLLPPEHPGCECSSVKIETQDGCMILSLQPAPPEPLRQEATPPAPAGGEDCG